MKKLKSIAAFVLTAAFLTPGFAIAQGVAPAPDINDRIRKEGMENSQIMKTLHTLTDVYGPRLTGSPKLKAAGEWAANQMKTWGFDRTELEPWDWGNPGWVN